MFEVGLNMKKISLMTCLAALLSLAAPVSSQTVGTISVGDISYVAEKSVHRDSDSLVSSITSGLNSALTESRKFNVLTYAELQKRLSDQGRSLEGYYKSAYISDSFDQAGLDYIVTADITGFSVSKQKRSNIETAAAVLDLNFKLYGVADITEDSTGAVSAKVTTQISSASGNDGVQAVIDASVKKAVDQLVNQMLSGLFPIRVMKISEEGAITLNYGKGLLAPGDTVKVYPKGIDIELDASGGPIGETIATLKIISSEKQFSIAQILDGKEFLEKGQQGVLLGNGS
jgi:hypothetical protein